MIFFLRDRFSWKISFLSEQKTRCAQFERNSMDKIRYKITKNTHSKRCSISDVKMHWIWKIENWTIFVKSQSESIKNILSLQKTKTQQINNRKSSSKKQLNWQTTCYLKKEKSHEIHKYKHILEETLFLWNVIQWKVSRISM